jgi:dehydrogenase/reductase SDR family protein 1
MKIIISIFIAKEASSFENSESVEFAGQAIANLAADPNYFSKTGRILFTCDLAKEYGFVDDDGDIHDIR